MTEKPDTLPVAIRRTHIRYELNRDDAVEIDPDGNCRVIVDGEDILGECDNPWWMAVLGEAMMSAVRDYERE